MTIEKRDVTFKSADNLRVAWFFLPQGVAAGTGVPAVAMAHGVGAVNEAALPRPVSRHFCSSTASSVRAAASRVNASSRATSWKTTGVR